MFLVTGGAGFIGSHIAEALVKRGDRVRILDNLSTGHKQNFAGFAEGVEFIEADLTDEAAVADAVKGVDCIFHQAALASVPRSVEFPLDTNAACVTGTVTLLDQARRAGVRRVVYAGSSSAYGDQPNSSKRETDLPQPLSPYAAAKLAAEMYCQAFYHTYGLETVCIRYFNVFGPRQDPDSPYSAVIPLFITAMLSDSRPVVYGDGLQSRDFTYVANVVHGNLLAATAPKVAGRSINVANGKSTTLLSLIHALNDFLGTSVEPVFEDPRVGDVRESMADITIARQLLQYEPQVDFLEGLEQSITYYRSILTESGKS
jgi:UDP-glucose 4-epimerase